MAQKCTSTVAEIVRDLDGFRVEIEPEGERADIVLNRPPLNIIRKEAIGSIIGFVGDEQRKL